MENKPASKRKKVIFGVIAILVIIFVGLIALFYYYPVPDAVKKVYDQENSKFHKAKIARCIYNKGIGYLVMPGYPDASGLFYNNENKICSGGILPGQRKTVDCNEVCCFKRLCLPINYYK